MEKKEIKKQTKNKETKIIPPQSQPPKTKKQNKNPVEPKQSPTVKIFLEASPSLI